MNMHGRAGLTGVSMFLIGFTGYARDYGNIDQNEQCYNTDSPTAQLTMAIALTGFALTMLSPLLLVCDRDSVANHSLFKPESNKKKPITSSHVVHRTHLARR